ncbi:response regulator transcription factor [Schaalia vaccimaxillae]|uniref:response regulator transcription factor n=1 Tax=Schaalia vaccimaxillae TaxID=183916 RepID=UPI0003B3003B|nr:response regulator transcription factor [Schaalia vaccimaxillae]
MSEQTVNVLVFSDDVDTRQAVIEGVGLRASKNSPKIQWFEAATAFGAREIMENNDLALAIMDAESKKEGGMSIARDLENTLESVPPYIFLTARQQDDWLASHFGAAAIVSRPLDPIVLQEAVAQVLAGTR